MRLVSLVPLAAVALVSTADAETLACISDRLSVAADESVKLAAMIDTGVATRFNWSSSNGRFESAGSEEAAWHPDGAAPGKYILRVSARTAAGQQTCEVSVVIPQTVLSLADVRRYFLLPNDAEPEGFASHSYILFGSIVSEPRKPAAREMLRAFLTLLRSVEDVQAVTRRDSFNLTMLPVLEEPPEAVFEAPSSDFAVDWVLENYDYDRALELLRQYSTDVLVQTGRELWSGPYIVSRRESLIVVHDMTNARAGLAERWVKLHVNQVTQQDWNTRSSESFVVGLLTVMNTWAEGIAKTKDVVAGWLVWFES